MHAHLTADYIEQNTLLQIVYELIFVIAHIIHHEDGVEGQAAVVLHLLEPVSSVPD